MTEPLAIEFRTLELDAIAQAAGGVAVFVSGDGKLDRAGRRVNRLTRGALERLAGSRAFADLKPGQGHVLSHPTGMAADMLHVIKLDRKPTSAEARKAGVGIAIAAREGGLTVLAGSMGRVGEIGLGLALRSYDFAAHKTGETRTGPGPVVFAVSDVEKAQEEASDIAALSSGVFLTRDLVNEPSNVLTTEEFARRLTEFRDLGVEVEVLDEDALRDLGMHMLLAVGQGSESPSKVVVMQWNGGGDEPPFALIGKGVVFDTGGISLKPAQNMEDMTMDMGGAGTVAGVIKAAALRKAKANLVGLVGLVENMPDGRAQRPGDVVKSMKGDTVEVINTDAEGRLVLGDVLWYAQERFKPSAMVDLATLTGAVIVAIGHEKAGVFSNDDALAGSFLSAAKEEGEGAWHLPLDPEYDEHLKSRIADMKNVGDRSAGATVAAQFLQRFVKDDVPWMHLDIAGVASTKKDTAYAPKGATGWGVLSLDRLIRNRFEV